MGTLTHKAARAAYGTAIDAVLKHVKKDREKGLLELVDLWETISKKKIMKLHVR